MNVETSQSSLKGYALKLGLGVFAIYGSVILFLVFSETRLVYPGIKFDSLNKSNWEPEFEFRDVWLDTNDGNKIHGWYLPNPKATRNVLLFHGNAEDVPHVSESYARHIGAAVDANVLVYDYRGFGKSEGVPNEANTIDDGESMLNWLIEETQSVGSEDIIYFGSSLGGGVAIGLAERRKPRHLILDRTFDAMTSAGAERYPWVPVKLMMRNSYDSVGRLAEIDVPLFQSHFTNDRLCLLKNARRLFESAKTTDKEFYEMPQGGHYTRLPPEYWKKLSSYFAERD